MEDHEGQGIKGVIDAKERDIAHVGGEEVYILDVAHS